jgi:HK97 family phage prohead protease
MRGSFTKAITEFMRSAHRPLLYHHSFKSVLGTVTNLVQDHIGVKLTAKVNHQPESSPLRWIYNALKNGTIKGLSAGGKFTRELKADGSANIIDVDLIECSATATPVLASTELAVISEGKALDLWTGGDRARRIRAAEAQLSLLRLKAAAMSIGMAARA